MSTPVLSVTDVNTFYGSIHALRGISLDVEQGEIVALIGGNGAGKSTTLNTISGIVPLRSGTVTLNGQDLVKFKAHEITSMGVVQVPEGRRIFARLTVYENLKMGAYIVSDKALVVQRIDTAFEMFPRLKERQAQVAGTLSGGEQQMLAMSRALMSDPKVLLLDEPSMGLAPLLVDQIFDKISELHARGTTILLVEQNARKALQVADRGYVIETGKIVLADRAEVLRDSPMVQKAYLGID
jgi:ABC-type branched-chain amino acid transport systems, ATPase component